jgi:hypothetical protein
MKNVLTVSDSINSETDKFVSVFIWLSGSMTMSYSFSFIYELASKSATYDFTGNLRSKW